MTIKDGRQMAETLDRIRDDHVARYRFAARIINDAVPRGATVADVGCGFGYGSFILASEGAFRVQSMDVDTGVFDFAREHYAHPLIERQQVNLELGVMFEPRVFAVVAFEVIEHLEHGNAALKMLAQGYVKMLVGSVPNEATIPFNPETHKRHRRHYTPSQIRAALEQAGWFVAFLGGQVGKRGRDATIIDSTSGVRTLVFVGVRRMVE